MQKILKMNDDLYNKIMESGNQDEKAQCSAYSKEGQELYNLKFFNKIRIVIFVIIFFVFPINPASVTILVFLFGGYEFAYYNKSKENILLRTMLSTSNINNANIRNDYYYPREH